MEIVKGPHHGAKLEVQFISHRMLQERGTKRCVFSIDLVLARGSFQRSAFQMAEDVAALFSPHTPDNPPHASGGARQVVNR